MGVGRVKNKEYIAATAKFTRFAKQNSREHYAAPVTSKFTVCVSNFVSKGWPWNRSRTHHSVTKRNIYESIEKPRRHEKSSSRVNSFLAFPLPRSNDIQK